MPTAQDFIEYLCEQIQGIGEVRAKKIFGEYVVYMNQKPIFLVCDNTVYVKCLDCVDALFANAEKGFPYDGAKERYILDVDDRELVRAVSIEVEKVTPIPKQKKKKPRL